MVLAVVETESIPHRFQDLKERSLDLTQNSPIVLDTRDELCWLYDTALKAGDETACWMTMLALHMSYRYPGLVRHPYMTAVGKTCLTKEYVRLAWIGQHGVISVEVRHGFELRMTFNDHVLGFDTIKRLYANDVFRGVHGPHSGSDVSLWDGYDASLLTVIIPLRPYRDSEWRFTTSEDDRVKIGLRGLELFFNAGDGTVKLRDFFFNRGFTWGF